MKAVPPYNNYSTSARFPWVDIGRKCVELCIMSDSFSVKMNLEKGMLGINRRNQKKVLTPFRKKDLSWG